MYIIGFNVIRYLNKLESMFLQKVNNVEKMINSQVAVSNKKKELAQEYDQLVPKLKLIQQKNKQLITEVLFKNKIVLILNSFLYYHYVTVYNSNTNKN